MNDKIEDLLLQFEHQFKTNANIRIDTWIENRSIINALDESDVDLFFEEGIPLEVELRFTAGQSPKKSEYLKRFGNYPKVVEEAFTWLKEKNQAIELSDFDVPDNTIDFAGSLNVNPQRTLGLPDELGRYVDIRKVGQGGFGVVCRATDSGSGEIRALKFPTSSYQKDSDYLNDVKVETEKSQGLEHPNIVQTYGMEFIDPYAFVVQEFIDGEDLKSWMQKESDIKTCVEMVIKIARGLHFAHRQGVTHCDIKPANILVDRDGDPKIGDFGLSFHEKDRLGLPRGIFGTPAYLAPEIAEGYFRQSDGRADIFSLGVILYEMLTREKPFFGSDRDELIVQILTKTPRPIRLINDAVDSELERICFRCLEKRTLDRYQMALDLEAELKAWLEEPAEVEPDNSPKRKFVPRGLRSYTAKDADFFLELLPGVRDRGNIPVSLSFWVQRILDFDQLETPTSNGFLFGPSGSGKSSFIKAGLIPLIQDHVETIYVESTNQDTEVRIIKALRSRFEDIPDEISLPEIFAGLSNGKWTGIRRKKKVLLVIDQFEQWISRDEPYDQTQLVRALKYCDGKKLQCLMMVRDDFIFACGRFADALGIHLREDENFKDIDLFNDEHAKKILIRLGQAYGRLPETSDLSAEQHRFLDLTIEQLSINHYVVCVRLTLFAEMFKDREWTVTELNAVGGVAGVGEQFLETNFGAEALNARHRRYRKQIQALLEELLPGAGRDIRGSMKSRQQLALAAGCAKDPAIFDEVVTILDDELKLITRTDPDASGDTTVNEETSSSNEAYYQLTHDYLVPSIRDWLNSELKNTGRGRALIRLRELSAQVVPGQPPKYLPSNLEWLHWQLSIRNRIKSEKERYLSRAAGSKFMKTAAVFLLGLIVLSVVGFYLIREQRNQLLMADVLNSSYEGYDLVLERVAEAKNGLTEKIKTKLEGEIDVPDHLVRLKLSSLVTQESEQHDLVEESLKPNCPPAKYKAILDAINRYGSDEAASSAFEDVLNNDQSSDKTRFRAIVGLLKTGSLQGQLERWPRAICVGLVNEPFATQEAWIKLLKPFSKQLIPEMTQMFRLATDRYDASCFSNSLFSYYPDDEKLGRLAELLIESRNEVQFQSIAETIEQSKCVEEFVVKIEAIDLQFPFNDKNCISAANKSLGLCRFKRPEMLIEILGNQEDELTRSYAIFYATQSRLPLDRILSLFDGNGLSKDFAYFGSLMILAERISKTFDPAQLASLSEISESVCLRHKNAACFSTGELIARRLAKQGCDINYKELRAQRQDSNPDGLLGNVWISPSLLAFSIIKPDDSNDLDRAVAVCTEELGNDALKIFGIHNPDKCFTVSDFYRIYKFCNQLSDKDELKAVFDMEALTPLKRNADLANPPINVSANGYRIPTDKELLAVGLSIQANNSRLGNDRVFLERFVRHGKNSENVIAPSGQLLPNNFGLFDLHGNRDETFFTHKQKWFSNPIKQIGIGGGNSKSLLGKSTEIKKLNLYRGIPSFFFVGTRLVRSQ